MLSEVYKARDEDNFCAVTALLMVDIIRYIIISHSEIDGPEQIQSARDVLRIYPDIERMLLSKGESHAIN